MHAAVCVLSLKHTQRLLQCVRDGDTGRRWTSGMDVLVGRISCGHPFHAALYAWTLRVEIKETRGVVAGGPRR
jgi:hypothetical protein